MGREIRRVPPNWEHPRQECPHSPWKGGCDEAKQHGGKCYQPMYDKSYAEAVRDWKEGFAAWEAGTHESLKYYIEDGKRPEYWEYDTPPDPKYYRPAWKEGEAAWYQVYQTVSEGSPVTPPFATQAELVEYLVKHGDFWAQSRGEGGVSRKAAEAFVYGDGWVPSMVVENGVLTQGIEIAAR